MKKINTIFAALTAALVLPFAACTTGNSDLTVALTPGCIIGDPTTSHSANAYDVGWGDAWAEPLSYTSGVATYEFEYDGTDAWRKGVGASSFKLLLSTTSTSTDWGNATLALNADYTDVKNPAGADNIVVTGLAKGEKYTIYVKASGATISAKIVGAAAPSYYLLTSDVMTEMTGATATSYTTLFTSAGTSANFKFLYKNVMYSSGTSFAVGDESPALVAGTTDDMTVTGLTSGKKYKVTLDTTDSAAMTVKVELNAASAIYIVGNAFFDGLASYDMTNAVKFTAGKNNLFTLDITATVADAQFKIAPDENKSDWSNAYWTADAITVGGGYVTINTLGGMSNATVTLEVGKAYTITVDGSNPAALKIKFDLKA